MTWDALIKDLRNCPIDESVAIAYYLEGPDKFYEWHNLVMQKFPKVIVIGIYDNVKMESITINDKVALICCNNNLKEIIGPNLTSCICRDNKLTTLNLPKTSTIDCENNLLTSINCPTARSLRCFNNKLTSIKADKVRTINCVNNNLTELSLPDARIVECYDNKIKTLRLPNVKVLKFDNMNENLWINNPSVVEYYDKNNNVIPFNSITNRFSS